MRQLRPCHLAMLYIDEAGLVRRSRRRHQRFILLMDSLVVCCWLYSKYVMWGDDIEREVA